ncbi:Uncharacterised protein [Mycobacteroides abscessus]|nr:Uncharacterised protein [Mycobacteroides abscessus]CPW14263.1 Uncharacterised protein [Mycobacteroides abscessus]CQA11430.1 Uncharacterised protein [Mycobacteroides abscessus]SLI98682.1 Uncharacterised protein [Mycobacteroides abscessus subsp. massiliense]
MLSTFFALRTVVVLVFYGGALARRPWATYGNLDVALNRLFMDIPRWAKVLLALAVLGALLYVSSVPENNYSELSRGIALGAMIFLITTTKSSRTLRSNPAKRIAGFPLLEMIGIQARATH